MGAAAQMTRLAERGSSKSALTGPAALAVVDGSRNIQRRAEPKVPGLGPFSTAWAGAEAGSSPGACEGTAGEGMAPEPPAITV